MVDHLGEDGKWVCDFSETESKSIGDFSTQHIRARIAHFTAKLSNRHQAIGIVASQLTNSEPRPNLEDVAQWIRQAKVVDAMIVEFGADPESPLLQDGIFVEVAIAKDKHGLTRQDLADMSQDAWDSAWDDFGVAIRRGDGKREHVIGCDFGNEKDVSVTTLRNADGNRLASPLTSHGAGWLVMDRHVGEGAILELLLETDCHFDRDSGARKGFRAVWVRARINFHGGRAWAYLPTTGLPMRAEVLPSALFRWPITKGA